VRGIPALARRAAAARPAVIHAHEPDSWLAGLLAARRCGARLVLDVHEHYPSRLDGRLPRALRPLAAPRCAAPAGRWRRARMRWWWRRTGWPATMAAPTAARRAQLRDPGGGGAAPAPGGPVTLLHLGALGAPAARLLMPTLLDACLREALPVGRFTDGSEPAFDRPREALGVAGRIERHGWLAPEARWRVAAGCDIGLVLFQPAMENHRLALPHKLFDCMLAGLPVIVPDFAQEVAAVVAEAGCGLAVDVRDAGALAAAVASLADPAARAAMGARGRDAALGQFGWAPEAARLVRLYRRLLAAPVAYSAARRPAPALPDP
jgi:hypothetical protein